jgi:His/Glu/Gln/Arg/opine family amino acid ABC transporter permease subunit
MTLPEMQDLLGDYVEWWPDLWEGLQTTVLLTIVSMALALLIGLGLALARLDRRRRLLAVPAAVFVELIRGSPLLLQLFYIYYVFPFFGVRLPPFAAGILGLGINYGAYLSEVFRAGIEAVDHGQWEAARALGMRSRVYAACDPAAGAADRDPAGRQLCHLTVQGYRPGLDHLDRRTAVSGPAAGRREFQISADLQPDLRFVCGDQLSREPRRAVAGEAHAHRCPPNGGPSGLKER